jgi:hypothetical protein
MKFRHLFQPPSGGFFYAGALKNGHLRVKADIGTQSAKFHMSCIRICV